MDKIRVLLVDDSAVVRRLVAAALNDDPELEVVGCAPEGRTALERLPRLLPDVVLLDLEMPGMDGLETLRALRGTHPRLPVLMFSRHTQRGVEATVQALTLGADDYVPKPGDGLEVQDCVRGQLIPKIKLLGARNRRVEQAACCPARPAVCCAPARPADARQVVEVVAVAASTGGPKALTALLSCFPRDWPVPVLVVQHMPPGFTRHLAERLASCCALDVREAAGEEGLSAGRAWVAPGDYHLVLARDGPEVKLRLDQGPPVNSCRPSADVLFGSAAEACGPGVLAVVLTGMGQDGLRGCERVRAAGGRVLVQDESSSVVWSMPGAVARAGLADAVLPLDRLGPEVVRRVRRGRGPVAEEPCP
jgi:two-component system, chemotaxis family, protein-glutamate methylesterase/glutaminase